MKIAVLGHGVVGSGVCEVLEKNREIIARNAGEPIEVRYILDKRRFPELSYGDRVISDYDTILNDPEITVVAEMLGGLHPAYEFARDAIKAGKSVVTSNKEVVAVKGAHLLELAREHGVSYLFEASVGGGIPLLQPLRRCFGANRIEEIDGILNGTTNYILTEMVKGGKSFEEALSEAQQKGYAEANPDADLLGLDTCRKISILASILSGKAIDVSKVFARGITDITLTDMAYAAKWGAAVKLVGRCRLLENGGVQVMVAPFFVPEGNPLYGVEDVFNAVVVRGDMVGDVMFYGRGAGKLPTASAVVSDIIEIALERAHPIAMTWEVAEEAVQVPLAEMVSSFFLRVRGGASLGNSVGAAFGPCEEIKVRALTGESGWITEAMSEQAFDGCRRKLSEQKGEAELLSFVRVLK